MAAANNAQRRRPSTSCSISATDSISPSLTPLQHARKVWIRHAKFLFASAASAPATASDGSGMRFDATRPGLLKAARGLLRRALAVLPQHKHVRTIVAFACLECVHCPCYISPLSSFCGGGHTAVTRRSHGGSRSGAPCHSRTIDDDITLLTPLC